MRRTATVFTVALLALLAAAAPAGAQTQLDRDQAVELGREAYRYGLPLLEFLRVRREQTSVKAPDGRGNAPVNEFGNARGFARPQNRTVVAPNVDTLYSLAHLDLGRGPIVLGHPDMGRRYFVFQLLDPYTNTFAYIGPRTTGRRAGRFAITWTKRPGKRINGVRVVRSQYRRVWVIGRTLVRGSADERQAKRLMRRYSLVPLSRLDHPPRHRPRSPGQPRRFPTPTGVAFLDALGQALSDNPPPARDKPLLRKLAAAGVGPGRKPSTDGLPPDVLDGLREGADLERQALPATVRTGILSAALANAGWYVPPRTIGDYGTNYALRENTALVGLGANTPAEAMYPIAFADATGQLLNGANRYMITFPAGQAPPARAFWSLTLYDLAGFLAPNAASRYAVGDCHPPLRRRPDGSIVVAIQQQRPTDASVNWLPAPAGGFRLNLRLYWPERSALTGRWRPPTVLRVG